MTDSRFSVGQEVVIVHDYGPRTEIGTYPIIAVGRKFFYVRDSFGKAGFDLRTGAENVKPGHEPDMRFAFTVQDWELEREYRRLIAEFKDSGVQFRNARKHSTRKLQAMLDILKGSS